MANQQLKIVSIVGPVGLGKTTLARAVYDSLQTQYVHKAFVPVGRNPEVSKVLKDILLELRVRTSDIATLDERQLVEKLRAQLQNVRFEGCPPQSCLYSFKKWHVYLIFRIICQIEDM